MSSMFSFCPVNVSPTERLLSAISGLGLLCHALSRNPKSITESVAGGYLLYRGATGHCLGYEALGKTKPDNRSRNVNIRVSQIVNKPRNEVYDCWRNLENLPLFMSHLESVRNLTDNVSEWSSSIPGKIWHLRWKSEIVKEIPNTFLGWQSLPGSAIENAGKIEFEDVPDGLGTRVNAVISYHAPFGIPGEGAARIFNSYFKDIIREDILNFKDFMESEKEDPRPYPENLNYDPIY